MSKVAPAEDDEDWVELDRNAPTGAVLPLVQVRGSFWGTGAKARFSLALRREAAQWVFDNEPRFRIQVGGENANKIRLIPDKKGGKFEAMNFKGTARLNIGSVALWPNEKREPVEATFTVMNGSALIELPLDFAKARGTAPPLALAAPARKDPAPGISITTQAKGLVDAAKAAEARRQSSGPIAFGGDPAPGRSALDQRRAAEAARRK